MFYAGECRLSNKIHNFKFSNTKNRLIGTKLATAYTCFFSTVPIILKQLNFHYFYFTLYTLTNCNSTAFLTNLNDLNNGSIHFPLKIIRKIIRIKCFYLKFCSCVMAIKSVKYECTYFYNTKTYNYKNLHYTYNVILCPSTVLLRRPIRFFFAINLQQQNSLFV